MKLAAFYRAACPVLMLALPLALAACQADEKPADQRQAAGEILPGSASDAMLPLDTLRSQPPLAPHSGAAAPGGAMASSSAVPGDAASSDATGPLATPAEPTAAEPAQ